MLGWRISRLGFVTPIVGEVSLGPLGNAHHYKPCKQCDQMSWLRDDALRNE